MVNGYVRPRGLAVCMPVGRSLKKIRWMRQDWPGPRMVCSRPMNSTPSLRHNEIGAVMCIF